MNKHSYKNNVIVNSGLYMGYVKNIKILLYAHKYNDNPNVDQILMNKTYFHVCLIKLFNMALVATRV